MLVGAIRIHHFNFLLLFFSLLWYVLNNFFIINNKKMIIVLYYYFNHHWSYSVVLHWHVMFLFSSVMLTTSLSLSRWTKNEKKVISTIIFFLVAWRGKNESNKIKYNNNKNSLWIWRCISEQDTIDHRRTVLIATMWNTTPAQRNKTQNEKKERIFFSS